MVALIKYVGQRVPVFEILFIRQLIVLTFLMSFVLRTQGTVFRTKLLRFHVMRGVFSAIAMTSGFSAVVHIPLAEATAISFVRVLFATLLGIVFLKEVVGPRRWVAAFVGFVGVLIVIHPDAEGVNGYTILALLSAFFVAAIMITLRKLSQVDRPTTIMTYQSVFVTLIIAGPAFYVWVTPSWADLLIILVVSGLMSTMQWCHIQAYKVAEVAVVAPVEYVRLLFATAIGILFFAEIPTIWTFTGAGVIIASTLYTVRRNAMRSRAEEGE